MNQGALVILVGKDEQTLKTVASKYPSQATVVITNITDDYQCKVSIFIKLINMKLGFGGSSETKVCGTR